MIEVRESASILGICPRTTCRLIASGEASASVKLRRTIRLVLAEVHE